MMMKNQMFGRTILDEALDDDETVRVISIKYVVFIISNSGFVFFTN